MSKNNLGRLQKVDLREAWESEANGFTPWLAQEENLKLLGGAIGIDLELESQEKFVGPFRAVEALDFGKDQGRRFHEVAARG